MSRTHRSTSASSSKYHSPDPEYESEWERPQRPSQEWSNSIASMVPERRTRAAITPPQLDILQRLWNETTFPSKEAYARVAEETGLEQRKVIVWFQNSRQKVKNQATRPQFPPENNTYVPPPLYSDATPIQIHSTISNNYHDTAMAAPYSSPYASSPLHNQSVQNAQYQHHHTRLLSQNQFPQPFRTQTPAVMVATQQHTKSLSMSRSATVQPQRQDVSMSSPVDGYYGSQPAVFPTRSQAYSYRQGTPALPERYPSLGQHRFDATRPEYGGSAQPPSRASNPSRAGNPSRQNAYNYQANIPPVPVIPPGRTGRYDPIRDPQRSQTPAPGGMQRSLSRR